jgi:hypothetical protein
MPSHEPRLKVGENHRRVVFVLLRGLEQMGQEIDWWLECKSGLLCEVRPDLTAEQAQKLQGLLVRLNTELRRLTNEIVLDVPAKSRKRAIHALLSAHIVNLEESEASKLRGYGRMSEEAGKKLDAEFARLLALLEEMAHVVEKS